MKLHVEPLHGGWAVLGDGWTAYGQTRRQALEAYRLARKTGKRHRRRARMTPTLLGSALPLVAIRGPQLPAAGHDVHAL